MSTSSATLERPRLPSFSELKRKLELENGQFFSSRSFQSPGRYSIESPSYLYGFSSAQLPHLQSQQLQYHGNLSYQFPLVSTGSTSVTNFGSPMGIPRSHFYRNVTNCVAGGNYSSPTPENMNPIYSSLSLNGSCASSCDELKVLENGAEFAHNISTVLELRKNLHFQLTTVEKQYQFLLKKKADASDLILINGGSAKAKPKYISKDDLSSFAVSVPFDSIISNCETLVRSVENMKEIRQGWKVAESGIEKKRKSCSPPKIPTSSTLDSFCTTGSEELTLSSFKKGHGRNKSAPGRMQLFQIKRGKKRKIHKVAEPFDEGKLSPSGQVVDVNVNPTKLNINASDIENPNKLSNGGLNSELSVFAKDLECNHCGSNSSPEWRRGPDGKRTLCNACGLFYSKLSRKYGKVEAVSIMLSRKSIGANKDRSLHL